MEEPPEHSVENVPLIQSLWDQVNYLWMIINTVTEVLRVIGTSVSHVLMVSGVKSPKRECTSSICGCERRAFGLFFGEMYCTTEDLRCKIVIPCETISCHIMVATSSLWVRVNHWLVNLAAKSSRVIYFYFFLVHNSLEISPSWVTCKSLFKKTAFTCSYHQWYHHSSPSLSLSACYSHFPSYNTNIHWLPQIKADASASQ